jgi:hypothetical protein
MTTYYVYENGIGFKGVVEAYTLNQAYEIAETMFNFNDLFWIEEHNFKFGFISVTD